MNTALWLAQSLLFVLFMYSGWMKSTRSAPELVAMGQTGVEHVPTPLIRFIGVSELVGAVGLLIPWYTQVWPILTPIAAVCLGLIMLPAGVIHYRRGEIQTVWRVNVTTLLFCLFVADGRFV